MSLPIANTIPHLKVNLATLLKTYILILKSCYVYNSIPFLTVGQVLWFSLAEIYVEKKKPLQNLVFLQYQCRISFLQLKLCGLWQYELSSTFLRINERILFHYVKNCGQLFEWSQIPSISKYFRQMHGKKKRIKDDKWCFQRIQLIWTNSDKMLL